MTFVDHCGPWFVLSGWQMPISGSKPPVTRSARQLTGGHIIRRTYLTVKIFIAIPNYSVLVQGTDKGPPSSFVFPLATVPLWAMGLGTQSKAPAVILLALLALLLKLTLAHSTTLCFLPTCNTHTHIHTHSFIVINFNRLSTSQRLPSFYRSNCLRLICCLFP